MSMFADARPAADARMKGMGMGEEGEDPMMAAPGQDPVADVMALLDQVQPPQLAEAIRNALGPLLGQPAEPEMSPEGEGALENDPVVTP